MLINYKEEQPIVYQILKNTIESNKHSHAYLFETNGYYNSIPLVFSFIKALFCPEKNIDNHCTKCSICPMIDSNNFPELKIIKPDGMWIKKEQLAEMMEEFNHKALIGSKKIYVILEAEKLNKASANSLLKFLEEPEDNIIAILVTSNIYQMLETIISRCQVISLKPYVSLLSVKNTENALSLVLYNNENPDEITLEKIKTVISFLKYYENNHLDTIIYMNKLWHATIKTKDDFVIAFEILIMYYKDILNYLLSIPLEYFYSYENDVREIAKKNTVFSVCHKLKTLLEYKEKIKFNVNTNLLMDKLIIELERG